MLSSLAQRLTKLFCLTNFKFISLLFFSHFQISVSSDQHVQCLNITWGSSITIFRKSKHYLLRYSSYLVVFGSSLDRKSSPKVRRNRQQMFCKIGVPKNFAKFTGKRRFWSLFEIKLHVRCFSLNLSKLVRRPFFTEHFQVTTSGRCFVKKVFFFFPNFTRKHLCRSLFVIITSSEPLILLKRDSDTNIFQ